MGEPAVEIVPEVEPEPADCPACGEPVGPEPVRCAVCGRPSHEACSVDARWCTRCFWDGRQ